MDKSAYDHPVPVAVATADSTDCGEDELRVHNIVMFDHGDEKETAAWKMEQWAVDGNVVHVIEPDNQPRDALNITLEQRALYLMTSDVILQPSELIDPKLPSRGGNSEHPNSSTSSGAELVAKSDLVAAIDDNRRPSFHLCKRCGKRFSRRWYLIRHIRSSHGGETPYVCIICNEQFAVMSNLDKHMMFLHAANKKLAYGCTQCQRRFARSSRLNRHCRKVHNNSGHAADHATNTGPVRQNAQNSCRRLKRGNAPSNENGTKDDATLDSDEKPFACSLCDMRYRLKSMLRIHMSTEHKGRRNYPCRVCGKTLTTSHNLKLHMMIHTGEKPYACSICCKKYRAKFMLNFHMSYTHKSSDTTESNNQCRLCDKTLSSKYKLKMHMLTHTGEKPYTCPVCRKRYRWSISLRQHLSSTHKIIDASHPTESCYECRVCGKTLSTKHVLKLHMMIHTGEKPYNCPVCRKRYRWRICLRQHLSSIHKIIDASHPIERNCECRVCGKTLSSKRVLKMHMMIHSGENPYACSLCSKNYRFKFLLKHHMSKVHESSESSHPTDSIYECRVCSKTLSTKRILQAHMMIHTGEKPFACSICCKKYRANILLKLHMRKVHESSESRYECHVCGKTLSTKHILKTHMMIHTGEKPFACSICCNKYRAKILLQLHMSKMHESSESSHPNESSYECHVCGKTLSTKGSLKTHMMIHTGEKPFVCSLCGKNYRAKITLQLHMSKVHESSEASHPIESRYECRICGKTLSTKHILNRHMMIHTGEKPYVCSLCGKNYRLKILLKLHIGKVHESSKASHPIKSSYECRVCGKTLSTKQILNRHVMIHTGEKPHTCSICLKRYRTKYQLRFHLNTSHDKTLTGELVCRVCGKTLSSKYILKEHMTVHSGKMPYTCPYCHKQYRWSSTLKAHMKKMHGSSKYCKPEPLQPPGRHEDTLVQPQHSPSQRVDEADLHDKKTAGTSAVDVPIDEAAGQDQSAAADASNLRQREYYQTLPKPTSIRHLLTVTSPVRSALQPPDHRHVGDTLVQPQHRRCQCDEEAELNDETLEKTAGTFAVGVPAEEATGKEQSAVGTSVASVDTKHDNTRTIDLVCRVCGKTLSSKSILNEHMNAHLAGENPYTCPFCHASYQWSRQWKAHMNKMHGTSNYRKPEVLQPPDRHGETLVQPEHRRYQRDDGAELNSVAHKKAAGTSVMCVPIQSAVGTSVAAVDASNLRQHEYYQTLPKPTSTRHPLTVTENVRPFARRVHAMNQVQQYAKPNNEEQTYNCLQCGEEFTSSHSLNYHLTTHLSNSNDPQASPHVPLTAGLSEPDSRERSGGVEPPSDVTIKAAAVDDDTLNVCNNDDIVEPNTVNSVYARPVTNYLPGEPRGVVIELTAADALLNSALFWTSDFFNMGIHGRRPGELQPPPQASIAANQQVSNWRHGTTIYNRATHERGVVLQNPSRYAGMFSTPPQMMPVTADAWPSRFSSYHAHQQHGFADEQVRQLQAFHSATYGVDAGEMPYTCSTTFTTPYDVKVHGRYHADFDTTGEGMSSSPRARWQGMERGAVAGTSAVAYARSMNVFQRHRNVAPFVGAWQFRSSMEQLMTRSTDVAGGMPYNVSRSATEQNMNSNATIRNSTATVARTVYR